MANDWTNFVGVWNLIPEDVRSEGIKAVCVYIWSKLYKRKDISDEQAAKILKEFIADPNADPDEFLEDLEPLSNTKRVRRTRKTISRSKKKAAKKKKATKRKAKKRKATKRKARKRRAKR